MVVSFYDSITPAQGKEDLRTHRLHQCDQKKIRVVHEHVLLELAGSCS